MSTVGDNRQIPGSSRTRGQPHVQGQGVEVPGQSPPPESSQKSPRVVVMRLNAKYLKSVPGILKIIQVVFLTFALIFLTTAEPYFAGYLLLPLDWHLRVFVFITVFSLLFSLASFIVHVYRLTDSLRIPWKKFDFICYCLLCFLLLFASSLVASAIACYDNMRGSPVKPSAKRHLVIASILGYISMAFYGASAYYAGRQLRGFFAQFSPQRFPSQHIVSQPTTPSTESTGPTMDNIVV